MLTVIFSFIETEYIKRKDNQFKPSEFWRMR